MKASEFMAARLEQRANKILRGRKLTVRAKLEELFRNQIDTNAPAKLADVLSNANLVAEIGRFLMVNSVEDLGSDIASEIFTEATVALASEDTANCAGQ